MLNTSLANFCPKPECSHFQPTDNKITKDGVYSLKKSGEIRQMFTVMAVNTGLAVCAALDDIPVLGSLLEWVGLAYVIWFSIRYLLFEGDRTELQFQAKVLKRRAIG